MMFRSLSIVCFVLAALASNESRVEGMIGLDLKPVAQTGEQHRIDSIAIASGVNRFYATQGRHVRVYDDNLRGGKSYELPVKAPCGKRGCREDKKYRCVLHPTVLMFGGIDNRTKHEDRYRRDDGREEYTGRESREFLEALAHAGRDNDQNGGRYAEDARRAREEDDERRFDDERRGVRFFDQYAVGCVSEGQQWGSVVGHNFGKEICHTESSNSMSEPLMITASDEYAGHFYYAKPSTREVCAIKNYARCRETGLCEPHVCVKLHSAVTCMGIVGGMLAVPERDQTGRRLPIDPDFSLNSMLAVGLRNGQVVFLRDMKLVNSYSPICNCVECEPYPIGISHSFVNGLTYILYERCGRRNFVNAISFSLGPLNSLSIIPPVTVSSTRVPGARHIACCPLSERVFLTIQSAPYKHYLAAVVPNNPVVAQRAAGVAAANLVARLDLIAWAPICGCPTALVADSTGTAYVASDKTVALSDSWFTLVSASVYANIEINGRHHDFHLSTEDRLITKYKLVVPGPGTQPIDN